MRSIDNKRLNNQRRKIGGKWKPLVMFLLYSKPERFNKIKQLLKKISANQLTRCMREMEADGLVAKDGTGNNMYYLTPTARKITELMMEIKKLVESISSHT